MKKYNRLLIACLLLGAVGAVTFVRVQVRDAEAAGEDAATLHIPKIDKNSVDELELTAPNHPKVRLSVRRGTWRMVEPRSAALEPGAVDKALEQLENLRIEGVAATKAKHYQRLGVDDREATHVVAKGQGKVLLDAYIGNFQEGHTMLRLHGQGPVGRVPVAMRHLFNKSVDQWRDRTVTKLEPSAVQEIAFENGSGRFHFERSATGWKQRLSPGGSTPVEKLDGAKVDAAVGTAMNLTAEGFAPPETTREAAGLGDGAATVWCKLNDGKELRFRVGNAGEKAFHLELEGQDAIYMVPVWVVQRFTPSAAAFAKVEAEKPADQGETANR